METWIKLYRKFTEWEWFNISEMVHLFIYLLISANNSDGEWRGITIKRGQLITGRKSINERTGISEQTIRTCLRKLESTKEITIKSTNKYSIITVCKYDEYQPKKNTTNQQPNQQLTSNQPATNHKQEYKELKNEKNIIPPLFQEVKEYCFERNNDVNVNKWFDFYESKGWMIGKNKMKDWKAAVRTWEKPDNKVIPEFNSGPGR